MKPLGIFVGLDYFKNNAPGITQNKKTSGTIRGVISWAFLRTFDIRVVPRQGAFIFKVEKAGNNNARNR